MIERQAAPERGLAEQQHGARVLVLRHDLAERGEAGGVARPFAEIGGDPRDQVAFVHRIEQFDRAHDFEPGRRPARAAGGIAMSLWPSRARAIWP